ncbi:DUF4157 domain-containing protein [Tenacibaculum sp. TC6]|uniref:eCIS core domain-containing protein n=1 Tax=Tenacibaculum sp. TC6 TaxID=3423223 RepID=UPI003D36C069
MEYKKSKIVQQKSTNYNGIGKNALQLKDNRSAKHITPEKTTQLRGLEEEEEELQLKADIAQKMGLDEEEDEYPLQRKENNTGLPDTLKSGIENISGYSMDDVQVHYNSGKPAQLNAHAYAQGTDIHVASGQEQHLPHEAWHVVQQKQGRVQPTMSLNGAQINDNVGLETEADVMGNKALQRKQERGVNQKITQKKSNGEKGVGGTTLRNKNVTQRVQYLWMLNPTGNPEFDNKIEEAKLHKQTTGENNLPVEKESEKESSELETITMADARTKIGDITEENKKKKQINYDSDSESEEELMVGKNVKATFDYIKTMLAEKGWELKKGNEGHCITVVKKNYGVDEIKNEESDEPDYILIDDEVKESFFYDDGEGTKELEKTVYYDPDCPLIDLIHELDHVKQVEEYEKLHGVNLITTWQALNWGYEMVAEEPKGGISSATEGPSRKFQKDHVNKDKSVDVLGKNANSVAEYQNYMLELLRYVKMNASVEEIKEIAKRVADHREMAEKELVKYHETDEEERDKFIEACEQIISFEELKDKYEKAGGLNYEK